MLLHPIEMAKSCSPLASDWAWKQGLEPDALLGVLGSVLICILAVLAS